MFLNLFNYIFLSYIYIHTINNTFVMKTLIVYVHYIKYCITCAVLINSFKFASAEQKQSLVTQVSHNQEKYSYDKFVR